MSIKQYGHGGFLWILDYGTLRVAKLAHKTVNNKIENEFFLCFNEYQKGESGGYVS